MKFSWGQDWDFDFVANSRSDETLPIFEGLLALGVLIVEPDGLEQLIEAFRTSNQGLERLCIGASPDFMR
jgi:hypothetical protein